MKPCLQIRQRQYIFSFQSSALNNFLARLTIFVLLFPLLASTSSALDWTFETVDTSSTNYYNFFNTSLELDSQGVPHISYAFNKDQILRYASKDASGWILEQIPQEVTGSVLYEYQELAIDSEDKPSIGYSRYYGDGVCVAEKVDGNWCVQEVASEGSVGGMVVNCTDQLHMAFLTNDYDIMYATRANAQWQVESLGDGNNYELVPAIAVDSLNRPHCAYWNYNTLTYAVLDQGQWQKTIVDTCCGLSFCEVSIAIDGNDRPHLVYESDNRLRHSTTYGESWVSEDLPVEPTANRQLGVYNDIVIDSGDRLYIAFMNSVDEISLASHNGTSWDVELLDSKSGNNPLAYLDLEIDSQGFAHLCYRRGSELVYAQGVPEPSVISLLLLGIAIFGSCHLSNRKR